MPIETAEHNDILIVPIDGETLADAFENTDILNSEYTVDYDAEGNARISDGGILMVEVIAEVTGGCVVRVDAALDSIFSLEFVNDEQVTEKIGRAYEYVQQLGGLEARKQKGKWRPISDEDRKFWAMHATKTNIQKLRVKAFNDSVQKLRETVQESPEDTEAFVRGWEQAKNIASRNGDSDMVMIAETVLETVKMARAA